MVTGTVVFKSGKGKEKQNNIVRARLREHESRAQFGPSPRPCCRQTGRHVASESWTLTVSRTRPVPTHRGPARSHTSQGWGEGPCFGTWMGNAFRPSSFLCVLPQKRVCAGHVACRWARSLSAGGSETTSSDGPSDQPRWAPRSELRHGRKAVFLVCSCSSQL